MIDSIKEYIEHIGKKRFLIYVIVIGLLMLNILGATIMIIADRNDQSRGSREYQELSATVHTGATSVDFDLLTEQNSDIRAWLISEGTGIDYPIVHGKNNRYYRNHLFSGKTNRIGCLYLDVNSSSDNFSDKNTVIYGRKQLDSLYKYSEQDYYDLLPSMTICTPNNTHPLLLYAGVITDDIENVIKTDFADNAEFINYISWLGGQSVFSSNIYVTEDDRIVTICANDREDSFVLVGVLR